MIRRPPSPPLFPSAPFSRSARLVDRQGRAVPHAGQLGDRAVAVDERDRRTAVEAPADRGARRVDVLQLLLRSEEHTSELQSRQYLVCRLLLEKKTLKNTSNL